MKKIKTKMKLKNERCHSLRYYTKGASISKEYISEEIINLRTKKCIILKLVDIIDFNSTFMIDFHRKVSGDNPVILLGTKTDLLPFDWQKLRIENWLRDQSMKNGLRPKHIKLISSKNGDGIRETVELIENLQRDRDIYVVGVANAGKSSFINKLIDMYQGPKDRKLTTSFLPGTTVDNVVLPLKNGTRIFDTPGIILPHHSITPLLSADELKFVAPKKRISPKIYRMIQGKSLFLGGFARIDFLSGDGHYFLYYFFIFIYFFIFFSFFLLIFIYFFLYFLFFIFFFNIFFFY